MGVKLYTILVTGFLIVLPGMSVRAQQADISLAECFKIAREQNQLIRQSQATLSASQYNLAAEKQSYLPKVDILAGYNYLSRPLEINLQTVRNGIVEGSARQNVGAVADIYKEITGNNLSAAAQERIYQGSKNVINGIYPDYNPPLSKQSYFTAGIFVRQPLFMGNKLSAARNIAATAVASNREQVALVQKEAEFLVSLQYIRILYLNSILQKQDRILESLKKNKDYADEMVKNQVLPPYQRNWTNVALVTAQSGRQSLLLDKQNALLELNKLLGVSLDNNLKITGILPYPAFQPKIVESDFWNQNPAFRLLQTGTSYARAAEKISKSLSLPNIFAIGNLQLYQKDLPVITPPWMVGVEMQWNIFNGTQTGKRVKAAKELVTAAKLSEENSKEILQLQLKVAANKIESFRNTVSALDSANVEASRTTYLIEERMKNQLSSPKDVNEAVLIEQEVAKAYYTALLGYYLAIAEYYNVLGIPQNITEIIP